MLPFFLACALPESSPDGPQALGAGAPTARASWESELPPETDSLPVWQGSWQLQGGQTLRQDESGLWLDQRHLAKEPIGTPSLSADNSRFVFTRRDPVPVVQGQLLACKAPEGQAPDWQCVVVAHGDRAVISQDGEQIAWVDVETGLASVWISAFDGQEPQQLTNVGIVSAGTGSPPAGFVPPPHQGPLSFEPGKLTWQSPNGPQSVVLP